MIEKHLTLSKNLKGPDHQASLEPHEFEKMIESIRQVEKALGSAVKAPSPSEKKNKIIARKSLVAARDIRQGEIFNTNALKAKRSGDGISPTFFWNLLGTRAKRNFIQDEQITMGRKIK